MEILAEHMPFKADEACCKVTPLEGLLTSVVGNQQPLEGLLTSVVRNQQPESNKYLKDIVDGKAKDKYLDLGVRQ